MSSVGNRLGDGQMPRQARLDPLGTLHHVIVRGIEKRRIDKRVLGSGDFVESILREAEGRLRSRLGSDMSGKDIVEFVERVCDKEEINPKELRMGSRRGRLPKVRSEVAYRLAEDFGIPLAKIARHLGVPTSAVSKALKKAKQD